MAQKPSIPKGTRDFNPEEVAKRNYIFETIKQQFELFGFQPIETPSFENSETLMGKYGDEGDRLIFKILNSGDFYKAIRMDDAATIYGLEKFYNCFKEGLNGNGESVRDSLNREFVKHYGKNEEFLNDVTEFVFGLDEFKKEFEYSLPLESSLRERMFKFILVRFARKLLLNSTYHVDKISEKALRYDLTVPFARYVVQHQNEIEFPFKRYQIQPVWRADRPQKGRFREFYQCDADVVGSQSLWQDVEFVQLYDAVFKALKLKGVTIKINHRKILSGIAEVIGAQDKLIDFTVALDKLDKIGEEKVKEEMLSKGISEQGIVKLQPLFSLSGTFQSKIKSLKDILSTSEVGQKGIEDLAFINSAISELGLSTASLQLDVTLARGLNYYTGAIFEVSAPKGVDMGSIGGGGRYDDLTSIFGLPNVSGVGISFGLDRIYLVLESLNLFPETVTNTVKALFINFGETEALACMKTIKMLRSQNINVELYPDDSKMKKQLNYANRRNIKYVVMVGESELASNTFTLKDMFSGEQKNVNQDTLVKILQ